MVMQRQRHKKTQIYIYVCVCVFSNRQPFCAIVPSLSGLNSIHMSPYRVANVPRALSQISLCVYVLRYVQRGAFANWPVQRSITPKAGDIPYIESESTSEPEPESRPLLRSLASGWLLWWLRGPANGLSQSNSDSDSKIKDDILIHLTDILGLHRVQNDFLPSKLWDLDSTCLLICLMNHETSNRNST